MHKLKQLVLVELEDLELEAQDERLQLRKDQAQVLHVDNQLALQALDQDKHHQDKRQLEGNEELIFTHKR